MSEIKIKACESQVNKMVTDAENSPIYLKRLPWSDRLFSQLDLSFQVFCGNLRSQSVAMSHLAVVQLEIPKT